MPKKNPAYYRLQGEGELKTAVHKKAWARKSLLSLSPFCTFSESSHWREALPLPPLPRSVHHQQPAEVSPVPQARGGPATPQPPVHPVRGRLRPTLRPQGARHDPHGRAAVQVRRVRQRMQDSTKVAKSHDNAQRGEAFQVQHLRQSFQGGGQRHQTL